MSISIFDLFSIGIGPSSSHTVGPMRAAKRFVEQLDRENTLKQTQKILIELYGSLALTGQGHGTHKAILLGLEADEPDAVDPALIPARIDTIKKTQSINLNNSHTITFNDKKDLQFLTQKALPFHPNGMQFYAFDQNNTQLLHKTYYSVGGGFIIDDSDKHAADTFSPPYPFSSAQELISLCHEHALSISELMLANERTLRSDTDIQKNILRIIAVMQNSINRGCKNAGTLPGRLQVKRRAPELFTKIKSMSNVDTTFESTDSMYWLNLFAIAVNEENAAGGQIVTAPTNGAAGVIPAVLTYYERFYPGASQEQLIKFMLTAGAIAILYKKGASISGAEVGCQGEVGVASSMAAAALAAVLGGSIAQIENAAEIAMEHHLGMTCDPVDGLVQIPCIERNAMGAVKAVNATRLALLGDGTHNVSLDQVIKTMKQTGKDMQTIYKETSLGGLAVNVIEC